MKWINWLVAILAVSVLAVSCDQANKDNGTTTPKPAKVEISPSKPDQISANGGSIKINLTANRDWKVTGMPQWLTVSPDSGASSLYKQEIVITAEENKGGVREAVLKFTAEDASKEVKISQGHSFGAGAPENAIFYLKNDFLHIKTDSYEGRAHLCREFPFELEWEFISVMNEEQAEVGIIKATSLFAGAGEELLRTELSRRYYAPVIDKIISVKERYGFSYWRVHTAEGNVSFTLHDTYRSIIRAGEGRVILMDVDGNRFEIENVEALDRKSYKKIELYL